MKHINFKTNHQSTIGLATLISLLAPIAGGGVALSEVASATTSTSSNTINLTIQNGCSISASGNTHAGTINPSTYAQIGGEGSDTTITISCNDGNGYTVYAVGYGNDEEGVNILTGQKTSNTIATGTAQSGDVSNWNFKLSDPTGLTLTSAYTNNSKVPDSSTAVATKKASTDPSIKTDSFKASYYAYISNTQPSDTYSGKVKYTIFHNAELIYNYTIRYNLNGGQGGPTPNPQTGTSNTGSVKLSGTEPTKDSHKFMGWCSVSPTGNNTDNPTCSGQTYTAGQDYILGEIDTDTTLYAMWKMDGNKYSITYKEGIKLDCSTDPMTGISIMPSPNPQTGTTAASSVNISSTTPTHTNSKYTFVNWCSVQPTPESSTGAYCPGTTYTPGQAIPLSGKTNDITLWAMWTYSSFPEPDMGCLLD